MPKINVPATIIIPQQEIEFSVEFDWPDPDPDPVPDPDPDPVPDPDPDPDPTGDAWTPELLGERNWLHWRAEDVPDGPVSVWNDWLSSRPATAVAGSPVKQDGAVHFSQGDKLSTLVERWACGAHKAVVMIFKYNSGNGYVYFTNGNSDFADARQGAVRFDNGEVVTEVQNAGGPNSMAFPVVPGKTHCIVRRWINGDHYMSIDGGPEIHMSSEYIMSLNRRDDGGAIGGDVDFDLYRLACLQGDMSPREVEKIMGWAHHVYGSDLPPGHAYESVAPTADSGDWQSDYFEVPLADWEAFRTACSDASTRDYIGTPLDLSGWSLDWESDMKLVRDQASALPADWYAPVHPAGAGIANVSRYPGNGVYVDVPEGINIRAYWQNSWWGGVLSSINLAGHGRTFEAPFYVECRFRATSFEHVDGGIIASWHAPIWFESADYVRMLTAPYNEIDALETYAVEERDVGECRFNSSFHRHDPRKDIGGRVESDSHVSNKTRITQYPNIWPGWGTRTFFDNEWIVVGFMVDNGFTTYLNGREVCRYPHLDELTARPLMMFIDNAVHSKREGATGGSDLVIDYVKVYKK